MEEKKERFDKFIAINLLILFIGACICAVVGSIFNPQSAIAHYQIIDNQVRVTVMKINFIAILLLGAYDIMLAVVTTVGIIYFAIKKRKAKK